MTATPALVSRRAWTMYRLLELVLALLALVSIVQGQFIPKVNFNRVYSNYPLNVFESQGTVIGNDALGYHLFVAGGFKSFPGVTNHVYTRKVGVANAPWIRRADMPFAVTHMAQVANGPMFCGAGGYLGKHPGRSTNTVHCYDLRENKWSRLPDLPGDRAGGGMALRMKNGFNELIFAGGVDREFNSFARHVDHAETWVLDLNDPGKGWVDQKAPIPNPRNHMSAVQSCGRLFWVGGQRKMNEQSGNQVTVNEWLPEQRTWKKIADLPYPLSHVSASVMAYKCGMLVVGGMLNGKKMTSNVLYWEPQENKWHVVGKYGHDAATPVCGLRVDRMICATAGQWRWSNRVFVGFIEQS